MNIVLVWIQGSGKGTMARLIQENHPYHLFEMGQKLRSFAELGLEDSKRVKELIGSGRLVDPETIGKILAHYLATHPDGSVIFDGVPRNAWQKELFDRIVGDYAVFYLDLPREEAIRRLSWRRIDPTTGESFPADFPYDSNPKTKMALVVREDDRPEAVRRRIEAFMHDTMPLLAKWAEEGRKVHHVDASVTPTECYREIETIMKREWYP